MIYFCWEEGSFQLKENLAGSDREAGKSNPVEHTSIGN